MIIEKMVYPLEKTERHIIIESIHDRIELILKDGKIRIKQDLVFDELPKLPEIPVKKGFWENRKDLKELKKELKKEEEISGVDQYDF